MHGMVFLRLDASSFAGSGWSVIPNTFVKSAPRSINHFDGFNVVDVEFVGCHSNNVAILLMKPGGLSMVVSTEMCLASPELCNTSPEWTWESS
jgi:hypothetical protein